MVTITRARSPKEIAMNTLVIGDTFIYNDNKIGMVIQGDSDPNYIDLETGYTVPLCLEDEVLPIDIEIIYGKD